MAITTRGKKGSALTHNELDANFNHQTGSQAFTGSLSVSNGNFIVEANSTGFTISGSGTNPIKFLSASNLNVILDQLPTNEIRISGSLWLSGSGVGSASGSKILMVFNG